MPELPEVETIRRGLARYLPGRKIANLDVRYPGIWNGTAPEMVRGEEIADVDRKGKLLVLRLSNHMVLTVHLKMTGQLIWLPASGSGGVVGGHPTVAYLQSLPHKHTHAIFTFDDGSHLYFNDTRKFGRLTLMPEDRLRQEPFVASLGPGPLEGEFTPTYLEGALAKHPRQPIKTFLLDQRTIAGLGNIYADESLFRAGIRPTRLAGEITAVEAMRLHAAIIETIEIALAHGGSTEKDYLNAVGEKGTYLQVAQVYHRTGMPCVGCEGVVERIVIGGRSTHFCPSCQK